MKKQKSVKTNELRFPSILKTIQYQGNIPKPECGGVPEGWFRFKKLGNEVLITNDVGDYMFLSPQDFELLTKAKMPEDSPVKKEMASRGFLLPSLDTEKIVERYRNRHSYLGSAPFLHIVVPTLRCNTSCIYCHAGRVSMSDFSTDMTLKTAKLVTDFIFKTGSPELSIEFQGGEPLANFDVIKFIIEYAEELNRQENRNLQFLLVSNLSLLDDEKMKFLIDHDVLICTSIDGPPVLHDSNRKLPEASSYFTAIEWMNKLHDEYRKMGRDLDLWHVDALLTASRKSLSMPKEIVDEYVSLGIKTIHIRPLNPMGFASKNWGKFGYTADEFVEFYIKALDYIIELNRKGIELIERGAALFLAKILTDNDPWYVDLRSPCGAGYGQIAYAPDGSIFTCDEGRMVARMGDQIFKIGDVENTTYEDITKSEVVRSIILASLLETLPGCKDCAYLPYCGVCPVYNYVIQKNIFGQTTTNDRCKINRQILDHIFTILKKDDPEIKAIFNRWIIQKPRLKNLAQGA